MTTTVDLFLKMSSQYRFRTDAGG